MHQIIVQQNPSKHELGEGWGKHVAGTTTSLGN